MEPFDAIVLAGGGATRLGGVDKAALAIGDRTLLDRTLHAVADADRIVVVGPPRSGLATEHGATIIGTQEEPPGGGPVAALAAGIAQIRRDVVIVLACDMPFFDSTAVSRLVSAVGEADAAVLVDTTGRRQYLAAAYRRAAAQTALRRMGPLEGVSMRSFVELLTIRELHADPETTLDCDTWDDIHRMRQALEER